MMGREEDDSALLSKFEYASPVYIAGERPSHKVRITRPFLIGTDTITLREFNLFLDDSKYRLESERNGTDGSGWDGEGFVRGKSFTPKSWGFEGQTERHPVVNISWNDARAFCEWLSKREKADYRLPSEAQWEYSCRAGTVTRYFCGDEPDALIRYANAADQALRAIFKAPDDIVVFKWINGKRTETTFPFPFLRGNDGYAFTAPVGSFLPNNFGLHDMVGNVWQWCDDWYSVDYYRESVADDPLGPKAGTMRLMRGGGFDNLPIHLRSAHRIPAEPSFRSYHLGFRIVKSVPESLK